MDRGSRKHPLRSRTWEDWAMALGLFGIRRSVLIVTALLLVACARRSPVLPVGDFPAVVRDLERVTGSHGHPGRKLDERDLTSLTVFDVTSSELGGVPARMVEQHQSRVLAAGAYLFVVDDFDEHGGNHRYQLAVAKTADQFEVVRLVGTDAANYGHMNSEVVAWLRAIHAAEPLRITGAGQDYVEGTFLSSVRDGASLAKQIHSFCPDFVDQGIGLGQQGPPEQLIQAYFRTNRAFFFWWD
jgi:hypothetical protein